MYFYKEPINILGTGISGYYMAFSKDIAKRFYSYLLVKNGHGTLATIYG